MKMRYRAALLALPIVAAEAAPLPSRFEADRVFVTPATVKGETLRLYTDTGGGTNLLCREAAQRLHLPLEAAPPNAEAEAELGKNLSRTKLPSFAAGRSIPANVDGDADFLVHDCKQGSRFGDGLLSQHWFAGRIWTWDYPAQRLSLEDANWKAPPAARAVPIGFRAAGGETPAIHMPRITVRIDGKDIDLLLDTGATGAPTKDALAAQPTAAPVDGSRATSFIARSTLEAWHAAHPDWRIVEDADAMFAPKFVARAIRVPAVDVAGWNVGPVWFTERPDPAFHRMMSSMTDRRVEGALGGNAFTHFRMTIDYTRATAYFECLRECGATPPPEP